MKYFIREEGSWTFKIRITISHLPNQQLIIIGKWIASLLLDEIIHLLHFYNYDFKKLNLQLIIWKK